MNASEGDILI